jgi:hypothetical protein
MRLRLVACASLVLFAGWLSQPVSADPSGPGFVKAQGRFYCEAPHGGKACNSKGKLTISLPDGYILDADYHQGSIPCCGGDESPDGAQVKIPDGVYMEFHGGGNGNWGIYNVELVADVSHVDKKTGMVNAWTITGDTYCGPSAAFGKGGCNMNGYGWIKIKKK